MADDGKLSVLGISGSLRRGSYNSGLLRAAQALAPEGLAIDIGDIAAIPLYNGDVEQEGFPESVQAFRERIRAADALLIVTPEYNYSVPGVLKNAIDWASRPPHQPFVHKPIAIMGTSPGGFGTTRAQHHLRQVFVGVGGHVLAKPEVMVPGAASKFDDKGNLNDEDTKKFVASLLAGFADWIRHLKGKEARA